MTEVSVVFPRDGQINVQHRESVEPNQEVSWRVQSFNPGISHVQITFENGEPFFSGSPQSPQKALTYSGDPGEEFASTTVYGRAPEYEETIVCKYTVAGIGGGADETVDPEIAVVVQPAGGSPSGSAGGG